MFQVVELLAFLVYSGVLIWRAWSLDFCTKAHHVIRAVWVDFALLFAMAFWVVSFWIRTDSVVWLCIAGIDLFGAGMMLSLAIALTLIAQNQSEVNHDRV